MVFQVPDQLEHKMAAIRECLHLSDSRLLQADALGPSIHLWRCAANPLPAIAFWLGRGPEDCVSYLALFQAQLGDLRLLEGKRAWTQAEHRKRGYCTALFRAAANEAPLMTDTGGVTVAAYRLWLTMPGFTRQWWDAEKATFVEEGEVAARDRFISHSKFGNRYQLVLTLADAVAEK